MSEYTATLHNANGEIVGGPVEPEKNGEDLIFNILGQEASPAHATVWFDGKELLREVLGHRQATFAPGDTFRLFVSISRD